MKWFSLVLLVNDRSCGHSSMSTLGPKGGKSLYDAKLTQIADRVRSINSYIFATKIQAYSSCCYWTRFLNAITRSEASSGIFYQIHVPSSFCVSVYRLLFSSTAKVMTQMKMSPKFFFLARRCGKDMIRRIRETCMEEIRETLSGEETWLEEENMIEVDEEDEESITKNTIVTRRRKIWLDETEEVNKRRRITWSDDQEKWLEEERQGYTTNDVATCIVRLQYAQRKVWNEVIIFDCSFVG